MPATKESRIAKASTDGMPQKLGIIAGGGHVPEMLLHACDEAGLEVFIVGFEGQTDAAIMDGRNYMMTRLGAAGQIINTLRAHDVRDLVLIGSIRRPSLAELKPDIRTAQFFARVGLKALGDDGLLKALREELEDEGFNVHGVHKFMSGLVPAPGEVGKCKPKKADWTDIERGLSVSRALGRHDVGQAVIVQEDIVLGVEAAEGTDELIRRCIGYRRAGRGGVLVKTCKPQQDRDLDLPAIGPQTVRLCAESGLSGIVVEAGQSIIVQRDEVARLANHYKLFVICVDPEGSSHAT